MKSKTKYFIGFSLLIAALLLLIAVNFRQSMQYYLTVDEMYGAIDLVKGKEFRLSGTVVKGSLQKDATARMPLYNFVIANGDKTVQVSYHGLAPDTFTDSSDVVVRGRLDSQTMVFNANHLLAKCASKYEAKLDHKPQGAAR